MKNAIPLILRAGLFFGLILLLLSACGMYDYPYIYPVPEGNIRRETNTFISINTSNDNLGNSYFTHFVIFYRIYISNINTSISGSADIASMRNINSALANNHTSINNISGSQSIGGGAAYTLLTRTLRFSEVALDNFNIDNILSTQAIGKTIELYFGHTESPYLRIDNINYPLIRPHVDSNDRFFINNNRLLDDINNIDGTNRDVTNNTDNSPLNSYALMYIMAVGMNTQTYAPIYSSPTFLGVLRLPD